MTRVHRTLLALFLGLILHTPDATATGGANCASATDLTGLGLTCDGNWFADEPLGIGSATSSGGPTASCWVSGVENDVWYKWTNTSGQIMEMQLSTDDPVNSGDSEIAAYADCAGNVELVCDDDGGTDFLSYTSPFPVLPGQTAYIQFDGWDGDVGFERGLFRCDVAGLRRGPYIQLGAPQSATIRWRSTVATDSEVRYGPSPSALSQSATEAAVVTEHVVDLTGLTPSARYYYSVGPIGGPATGATLDHHFTTSPPAGTAKPTRIWVLGDSGWANAAARRVRDRYDEERGCRTNDLWLMLGDNAYNSGTEAEYTAGVFDTFPEHLQTSTLWPCIGNHDAYTSDSPTETGPYFEAFSLPRGAELGGAPSGTEAYYSFDFGNIHFVVLDSDDTDRGINGAMRTWLEADLSSTTREWLIAFFHHAPYTKGSHDSDDEQPHKEMRQNFLPLLEDHGVDLVLSGHTHSYERSFLVDGHYDKSNHYNPDDHLVDGGDGRTGGDGAYSKPSAGGSPHNGAVFVAAGNASEICDCGDFDHPVMYTYFVEYGSMILEVTGSRLDFEAIDDAGSSRDHFSIFKGAAQPPRGTDALTAVAVSSTEIDVGWTDEDGLETGFRIERTEDQVDWVVAGTTGANSTSFTDGGLDASTAYTYRVSATNASGLATLSDCASATTDDCVDAVPGEAIPLSISKISPDVMQLSWPAVAGAADYRVARGQLGNWFDHTVDTGVGICATTSTSLDDPDDLAATTEDYFYLVAARNSCGMLGSWGAGRPQPIQSATCP